MPQRLATSAFIVSRFSGSGCFSSFGTLIHCSPRRRVNRTPPVAFSARAGIEAGQGFVHALFEPADELGRIQGLAA